MVANLAKYKSSQLSPAYLQDADALRAATLTSLRTAHQCNIPKALQLAPGGRNGRRKAARGGGGVASGSGSAGDSSGAAERFNAEEQQNVPMLHSGCEAITEWDGPMLVRALEAWLKVRGHSRAYDEAVICLRWALGQC